MAASYFSPPSPALDANANPNEGGKWYFYATGTTTPQAVYADSGLITSLGSTVTADAAGRFADIYFDESLAYRAILKSADGANTYYDIDPVNVSALRSLSASSGASLVGYTRGATGAVAQTLQTALRNQMASPQDFGAVGDGATDDTAAVLAWLNAGGGVPKPGTYKLTSAVEVPVGAVIIGPGSLYRADTITGQAVFHFAHTGKGFTFTGASGARHISGIATKRTQPTPGVGWTPTAHDWDFYITGATDVCLENILLLNPTKGIICTAGGGRHVFRNISGQPLSIGLQVDYSADVTRIDGIHFWDFWSSSSYVTDYTTNNATAIQSNRNDNCDMADVFAIFYRYGLKLGAGTGGNTTRLRGSLIGFDACGSGVYVESGVNGFTVDLDGFYAHGHDTTITSGNLIDVIGTNGTLSIHGTVDLSNAHRSGASVTGSGSVVNLWNPKVVTYNMANGGYVAYTADTASGGLYLNGKVTSSGGTGGAAAYGGTGKIYGVLRSYTPTITSGTGAFTGSATITTAYYTLTQDGFCEGFIDIVLPTNNTAATDVRFTVPYTIVSGSTEPMIGRQVTANKVTVGQPIPGGTQIAMVYYDGTYPGATGANLTCRFKVRV
jgi:hypothetical protein